MPKVGDLYSYGYGEINCSRLLMIISIEKGDSSGRCANVINSRGVFKFIRVENIIDYVNSGYYKLIARIEDD